MEDKKSSISQPITQQQEVSTVKKNLLFKILIPTLIFLVLAIAGYYTVYQLDLLNIFTNSTTNDNEEQEFDDIDDMEDSDDTEYSAFEGEYIPATVPVGWSIVEYNDGEGTTMLPSGTSFTGLTGIKIFKEDTEVFYVQAIYGIGFAGCGSYAKFEDENPDYYAQILEDNEISGEVAVVTDYSDSEYTEFEWLDKTFRRIDDYYNYDTVDGNEYFEPSCVPSLVTFEGLGYIPEDGPVATSYDYGLKDTASAQDWLVIDEVLESIELIN